MQEIFNQIQHHGDLFYLLTFIWTALEGETFVIFAGLAAQQGLLNIFYLFIAAALGSMLGDQAFFLVGRHFGRRVLDKKPHLEAKLDHIFKALDKYAVTFILSYRFMYGVRNISALAIGMSPMPWKYFAFWNTVASFLWSFVFCAGGYLIGVVLESMGMNIKESDNINVTHIMIGILLVVVVVVGLRLWAMRNKAKETERIKRAK